MEDISYNKNLVITKAKDCFPNENLQQVLSILNLYGLEEHEGEVERVQIAILKLSENDLQQLKEAVQEAKRDYRNVLAWAEFPDELLASTWEMNNKVNDIRNKDKKQYLDWLNG